MIQSNAGTRGPLPIGAAIKFIGEPANFTLILRVAIEISRRRQHARKKKSRIHGRHFALPRSTAAGHVQEVIIKTLVASSVRIGALLARGEKAQLAQGPLNCLFTSYESAHDANRICG